MAFRCNKVDLFKTTLLVLKREFCIQTLSMSTIINRIRVGIIGVDPGRGWASVAHMPAIKALPQYELIAISNRNPDKLVEASKSFQVARAFTDAYELINSPEVDLVVVTVKVPYHKELV